MKKRNYKNILNWQERAEKIAKEENRKLFKVVQENERLYNKI